MKTIALLSISLLLLACASSDDFTGGRLLDCKSGEALEVRAGIDQESFERGGMGRGEILFLIEVANNSHEDVTVKSIGVSPRRTQNAPFENVTRAVNQDIAEGSEHLFKLPTTAFSRALPEPDSRSRGGENYEFSVHVNLTNGDSYVCHFEARLMY